jgi:predicted ribonuclease YlaK
MSDPKTRIVFLSGPAGSAKSFLSVYPALQLFSENQDLGIMYIRSVVESADRGLGFLKGDVNEKFGPYLAPLEDKIDEILNEPEKLFVQQKKVLSGMPVNFIRGQSWREKVVIVDEAQNLSPKELTTIITRIGRNTKIFFCGDLFQSDIKNSGFKKIINTFDDEESRKMGIYALEFDKKDIIRDKLLSYIIDKLEKS